MVLSQHHDIVAVSGMVFRNLLFSLNHGRPRLSLTAFPLRGRMERRTKGTKNVKDYRTR